MRQALEKAPVLIRANINDWLREAHERVAQIEKPPPNEEKDWTIPPGSDDWPDDPILELLAEVEAMDADGLALLKDSASWRVKTRDLFPPDQDRIAEAIEARKLKLKGSTSQ